MKLKPFNEWSEDIYWIVIGISATIIIAFAAWILM